MFRRMQRELFKRLRRAMSDRMRRSMQRLYFFLLRMRRVFEQLRKRLQIRMQRMFKKLRVRLRIGLRFCMFGILRRLRWSL